MERQAIIAKLLARREVATNKPKPRKLAGRCWLWKGGRQSGDDYGRIRIGPINCYTHRVSAHVWLGMPLDSPLMVRHRCIGSAACFNPMHLRVGTRAENNRDIVTQGRHRTRALTPADVSYLVARVRSGKMSIGKWALLNGVAYCTAYRAYHGRSHADAARIAHERWDRRVGIESNPLLFPPPAWDLSNPPPGCAWDYEGGIIVVDAVAAGIPGDLSPYPVDDIPF